MVDETGTPETPDDTVAGADDLPGALDPRELVANARRRHGAAGAILAAGMLAIDEVLGRKPKEEAPIVVASPTEPTDIDTDGIEIPVDETTTVYSPPRPSTPPVVAPRGRKRR